MRRGFGALDISITLQATVYMAGYSGTGMGYVYV